MKELDRLQLIDVPRIAAILKMEKSEIWQLILENIDALVANERRETSCIYGYKYGMEHFEKVFHRFHDEDPDSTYSGLIHDLCFIGAAVPVSFFSRDGYLDHISSAEVRTSRDVLRKWDQDSEAWIYYREFDVLSADHVELMIAALRSKSHMLTTDEMTAQLLSLKTLSATLRSQPTLSAAYLYENNYQY